MFWCLGESAAGVLIFSAHPDPDRRTQLVGYFQSTMGIAIATGAFLGGMYLAIDTTAGERERQSLEPLLVNPATRAQIVLGKLGATFSFAMASMMLSLVAFALAFQYIPLDELGMKVDFGPGLILRAGLLMVPLVLVFAALQTIVAAYAKSYREAQTYLSLLMLLPMLPSVILMINPMRGELWMSALPLLSQNVLIMALARGEGVALLDLALSFGVSMLLAIGLCWVAVRIYHRESLAVSA
jgi:sodium transport system permease protein